MIIIITTALGPDRLSERMSEYKSALEWYSNSGFDFKIVECYGDSSQGFFERYSKDVFYPTINDSSIKNKGVNEAKALLSSFKHFGLMADEFLVKVTGRYLPTSTIFFERAASTQSDALLLELGGQAFFGCIGIRAKHFEDLLSSLDLQGMEKNMVNIEKAAMDLIRGTMRYELVDEVGMLCNIAFNGVLAL